MGLFLIQVAVPLVTDTKVGQPTMIDVPIAVSLQMKQDI